MKISEFLLKVPSLARSVPKPLKVPSLARSVPKPLKVPSLARSVQKPLKCLVLHVLCPILVWGKPERGKPEGSRRVTAIAVDPYTFSLARWATKEGDISVFFTCVAAHRGDGRNNFLYVRDGPSKSGPSKIFLVRDIF